MNITEDEHGFKEIKAKVLNTVIQQKLVNPEGLPMSPINTIYHTLLF